MKDLNQTYQTQQDKLDKEYEFIELKDDRKTKVHPILPQDGELWVTQDKSKTLWASYEAQADQVARQDQSRDGSFLGTSDS